MKAFKYADKYQVRIVTFVDVMGMKNAYFQKTEYLQMYSTILNMFANQHLANVKLQVSLFSNCMYVVAKKNLCAMKNKKVVIL